MRKGIKLYGLLNHKKCFYGGSLFLLLLFITSCKSNQFLIDSNEVWCERRNRDCGPEPEDGAELNKRIL